MHSIGFRICFFVPECKVHSVDFRFFAWSLSATLAISCSRGGDAGVVIAFALSMQGALRTFIDLMKHVFVLEASGPALKRLTDIVQDRIPSLIEEDSDPRQMGNVAMKGVSFAFRPVISGEMESCLLENVSTKPTTPGVQVFKDLSFSIAAGKKVAVMGRSGSGKSVLFKVRFLFQT